MKIAAGRLPGRHRGRGAGLHKSEGGLPAILEKRGPPATIPRTLRPGPVARSTLWFVDGQLSRACQPGLSQTARHEQASCSWRTQHVTFDKPGTAAPYPTGVT